MSWTTIPFTASPYAAQLASGSLVRFGALLKDAESGRIVAHLQETGAWREALGQGLSMAGGGPVTMGAAVFQTIQGEQIKSKLDAVQDTLDFMEGLQWATLSASVLGIGVTVASTALMMRQLSSLGDAVRRVETGIEALPAQWQEARLQDHIVDLQTQLARLDESDVRSDRVRILPVIEADMLRTFTHIAAMTDRMAEANTLRPELLRILFAALALCGGAQFRALVLLDECDAAGRRGATLHDQIMKISWRLPADTLRAMPGADTVTAESLRADLHELRARIASQPPTARMLIESGTPGPAFLEAAEAETGEAFLVAGMGRGHDGLAP